jgi:hypothetical protein
MTLISFDGDPEVAKTIGTADETDTKPDELPQALKAPTSQTE